MKAKATENGNTIVLTLSDTTLLIEDHECVLIALNAARWPALKAAVLALAEKVTE